MAVKMSIESAKRMGVVSTMYDTRGELLVDKSTSFLVQRI